MDEPKSEEKSPLLLYMVENDGNVSKNNKRVNFDKGRLYGISSGATAVFTDFPNYISPCWMTALISFLVLFMMMLLMISTMGTSSITLRIPRCLHSNTDHHLDNATIHLVHPISNWSQDQLEVLEKIKQEYGGFLIKLTLIHPEPSKLKNVTNLSNSSQTTKFAPLQNSSSLKLSHEALEIKRAKRANKLMKRRKRTVDFPPLGISFGMKGLLDMLLKGGIMGRRQKRIVEEKTNDTNEINTILKFTEMSTVVTTPKLKTLDDIICDWPGVVVTNLTYKQLFESTPLSNTWSKLSSELADFAIRVIQLWQHGGLSFKIDSIRNGSQLQWDDIEDFSVTPGTSLSTMEPIEFLPFPGEPSAKDKLENFIMQGRRSFESLRREVVTADDEGLHIFAKTPCHVFFGQVLVNLRRCKGNESPRNIIQKSLRIFCKHSAVGNGYCKNLEGVNQRV
ncbi:uncharacterized protein LOC126737971 [Anthonomus grandis grandis]|uniref:uncharacterized protein LOC126737971 n=1 Tax=Anthonomus grandis grandis TaxID=2921223 RepID=UPI0021669AF5|nr:uncharacterized protein LOC126737971 [Anthonomus grandis grandis]